MSNSEGKVDFGFEKVPFLFGWKDDTHNPTHDPISPQRLCGEASLIR